MTPQKICPVLGRRDCLRFVALLLILLFCGSTLVGQTIMAGTRRATIYKSPSLNAVAIIAVRNLGDENWLETLEVATKNISGRPLYCVQILLTFSGVVSTELDGVRRRLTLSLEYGRLDLIRPGAVATLDDKPIEPGENYVFKISEVNRRALEERIASGKLQDSQLQKFAIRVESVSFGDGTGFRSGLPYPR